MEITSDLGKSFSDVIGKSQIVVGGGESGK